MYVHFKVENGARSGEQETKSKCFEVDYYEKRAVGRKEIDYKYMLQLKVRNGC